MVKSWLKRSWNVRPFLGLLLAVVVFLGVSSPSGAAEPSPAPPQGQAQAAKQLARKAAQPAGSQSAPAKQAAPSATPSKWGPVEAGRRDPFNVPKAEEGGAVVSSEGIAEAAGPIPPGKKGLVIAQLRLEGVVNQRASNTMIAVVATPANRAYFLRVNDEVYNGVVSKITSDSVYFTENGRDPTGQMVSRQVVKKLGSGPGEK